MSYRYKTDGFAHLEEHHTDMKQCEAVQFPHGWELCSEPHGQLGGGQPMLQQPQFPTSEGA